MGRVGGTINLHTKNLQHPDSTLRQLKVSKEVAHSLNTFSNQTERVYVQLAAVGDSLSEGLEGWSKWAEQAGINKTVPAVFSESLRELTANMQKSNELTQTYIDSIRGSKGVSSVLDMAVDRHIGVMERILQKNIKMRNACLVASQRFGPTPIIA
jgi:hypothetical protein